MAGVTGDNVWGGLAVLGPEQSLTTNTTEPDSQTPTIPADTSSRAEVAAPQMWTRKDIAEFKSLVSKDTESVVNVGSGELVTVSFGPSQLLFLILMCALGYLYSFWPFLEVGGTVWGGSLPTVLVPSGPIYVRHITWAVGTGLPVS